MSSYAESIKSLARPLERFDDLTPLINQIKDKKVVMLGESSHGTSEYYQWRREISLELIKNHGFSFIAVEGDWPPCQKACQYIENGKGNALDALMAFDRWPTWMWANTEVGELLDELKALDKKTGFHGLDVYSLVDSVDETVKHLHKINPSLASKVFDLYSCFEPFRHDEKEYARSLIKFPDGCREEVVTSLQEILKIKLKNEAHTSHLFNALQNAKIVHNAEKYYRAMVSFNDNSWNVRDHHMMDVLGFTKRNNRLGYGNLGVLHNDCKNTKSFGTKGGEQL